MKRFKGTKGEWTLQSEKAKKGCYPSFELMIDFSKNLRACVSLFCSEETPTEEELANTKLIASAPQLLEALLSIENDNGLIPEAIWDLRNKAISKALD